MISSYVLDRGLTRLVTETTKLTIVTQMQPMTYAEATDPERVLASTVPIVSGPMNASPYGRKVTVNEITDGQIVQTGTAVAWALVDDNNQRCLASGELDDPKDVSLGNAFTLDAFAITLPGEAPTPAPVIGSGRVDVNVRMNG